MNIIYVNGKTFKISDEGFLLDFTQWCDEWAEHIKAQEEYCDYSEEDKAIIRVTQDYWKENKTAPMMRTLSYLSKYKLKHIYELFPVNGPKGACKVAGLPNANGCI